MAWTERYVRADASGSGAGTADNSTDAWTLPQALAGVAAGTRVNIRAGTYSHTTSSISFSVAGTTTAPIWWRGFRATAGDLDTGPTLASPWVPGTDTPLITFTTGQVTVSAVHQIFSNLAITGACTAEQVAISGGGTFERCRFTNTNAAAGSQAVTTLGQFLMSFAGCMFQATSSATRVFYCLRPATFYGCSFFGGGIGLDVANANVVFSLNSSAFRAGSHGVQVSVAIPTIGINGCTFSKCGGDGIRFTTLTATPSMMSVANCLFSRNGGYGINNASGTNTNIIHRYHNAFYSNTSGAENGFGDSPSLRRVDDGSSPFVDEDGGDLSLVASSAAVAAGCPGVFEGRSFASYLDIGAVQREEPEDGGGGGDPGPTYYAY